MKLLFLSSLILFTIFSCKTREDIAREQLVENLNVRISDQSKLSADSTSRLENIEEKLSKLTGTIEEQGHHTETTLAEKTKNLEARMKIMEENNSLYREKIEDINNKLKAQEDYLQSVVKALDHLSNSGVKKPQKGSKKTSLYDEAMQNYKKGKYKTAKEQFLTLIDKKKVKGNQKARVLHNLGMVEYMHKDNQKALFYFSRLYTDYPKAPYNKNGLLFLAKTFKRLGQKSEAVSTLNELISKYPKARQVKEAQKILAKMQ